MRPLASLLLVLAVACTGSDTAVAPERGTLPTGLGVELGAAHETARAFLEAYEEPRTLSEAHRRLVAGPDLREWVYWAGVQNAGLDFLPQGEVEIRTLALAGIEGAFATFVVDAFVEVSYRDEAGEIRETQRQFMSPMILGRIEGGGWRVVDAVRDARPMSTSIGILDPPAEASVGPAVVEIASVFRFSAATLVNLRVENRGDAPLSIDDEGSILVVNGEAGEAVAMTASLTEPIEPGETVEGGLTFPTVALTAIPQFVTVHLDGRPSVDVPIELPAEPFAPPMPQSGSNSGGTGSSGV